MEDDCDNVIPNVPLPQKLCRKRTPRVTQSTLTYNLLLSAEEGTEGHGPLLSSSGLRHTNSWVGHKQKTPRKRNSTSNVITENMVYGGKWATLGCISGPPWAASPPTLLHRNLLLFPLLLSSHFLHSKIAL